MNRFIKLLVVAMLAIPSAAMAQVECGQPIDEAKIFKAYDMA